MTLVKSGVSRFAIVAALSATLGLSACNTASNRTAGLGLGGASIGAAIGGARGGASGAIAGAVIGGVAGLLVGLALDEIERRNLEEARMASARSGGSVSRSFKNSSGKSVRMVTKPVRTYDCGGSRCRELSTSITRDGQTSTESATAREVKSAGRSEWVVE